MTDSRPATGNFDGAHPAAGSRPGATPWDDGATPWDDNVHATPGGDQPAHQMARLRDVMRTLRRQCPWDFRQTHRSLVPYLIEETCEVVEAIEAGDDHQGHLQEELGDLLFQVIFHSAIAEESDAGFDLADVARGVADKLIARHPDIYGVGPAAAQNIDAETDADDSVAGREHSWEVRKAREKGRRSVLEDIPEPFSALARANKIITRARAHALPVSLPAEPAEADEIGRELVDLVARAQAGGIDPEQAARDAVRDLEIRVEQAENRAPGENATDRSQ